MPTFANTKTSFNYLQMRKQIETICSNQKLSTEERAKQIYSLLPVIYKNRMELYFGPNGKYAWNLKNTTEGQQCDEFIKSIPSIVPVEMIIKKYQDVMDANPIDINKGSCLAE